MTSGKRLILVLAALAASAMAPASAGAAATIVVEPTVGSNTYAPANVIRPLNEASFTWIWGPNGTGSEAPHNVLQDAGLFTSAEADTNLQLTVRASAGSFPYFCSIHFGMDAKVGVRPLAAGSYPDPFVVTWATRATETGRRFDVRFKAGGSKWRIWRDDTTGFKSTFGRNDQPVEVKNGVTYQFQARSKRTDRKFSNWSPTLKVGPQSAG